MGHAIAASAELMRMQGRIPRGLTDPVGLIEAILARQMFGIDHRPVPGFGGRGETRLVVERGKLMLNTRSPRP